MRLVSDDRQQWDTLESLELEGVTGIKRFASSGKLAYHRYLSDAFAAERAVSRPTGSQKAGFPYLATRARPAFGPLSERGPSSRPPPSRAASGRIRNL
jgi:hypothetical protein